MSVPNYWKNHLDEKIEKICSIQKNIGEECISFAMITDIHWGLNARYSGALLTKVMKDCNIPFYFNGGDTFSAAYCSKECVYAVMEKYFKAFSEIEDRCLLVMGDRDATYGDRLDAREKKNLSKTELAECYFNFLKKYPNRTFGDDTYYFVDDNEKKMRYIVLNTHDIPSYETNMHGWAVYNSSRLFCIREPQLNWLAHVALDVPSQDWSVVICSHENANAVNPKHITHNNVLLKGIINAFQNHTSFSMKTQFDDEPFCNADISVDFTEKGGNFIAWLGGHDHQDLLAVMDNIVCVTTMNDSYRFDCGYRKRIFGTFEEHSFDVFLVDKNKRKVNIVRVGYGDDREFSY